MKKNGRSKNFLMQKQDNMNKEKTNSINRTLARSCPSISTIKMLKFGTHQLKYGDYQIG